MSRHMGREREFLAKLRMLEQEQQKKYDELDEIFQQIVDTNAKIEEQRQKQQLNRDVSQAIKRIKGIKQ